MVAAEPVVVKLFEAPVPAFFPEARSQSARCGLLFKNGHLVSRFGQVIGSSHAAHTRTDHSDSLHASFVLSARALSSSLDQLMPSLAKKYPPTMVMGSQSAACSTSV